MMPNTKAHKKGHADGVFKRPHANPFASYTHNWHAYNAGYLVGYTADIHTENLTEKESE